MVEYVESMTTKMTFKYLQSVIKLYNNCGFQVQMAFADKQFNPLKPILQEKHNIMSAKLNATSEPSKK